MFQLCLSNLLSLIYVSSHFGVLDAELYFEKYSNRVMVIRDQKVLPEVQNRLLLQRIFGGNYISEDQSVRPIIKFTVQA